VSVVFGIGIGASGAAAVDHVDAALLEIRALWPLLGVSRRYANPPWGGVTRAPFVNAAAIIATTDPSATVLMQLFAIERAHGRLRTLRNAARTLDLDVLWSSAPVVSSSSSSFSTRSPIVPHPRLLQRGFAVVPLLEAIESAGLPVPRMLHEAAATSRLRPPLRALPASPGALPS
jgi:2-amino-4-hydroxy-6-hydroxymethyldihydropteridine diphosphokinase